MKLSIVIPVFNSEFTICKIVENILIEFKKDEIEIILINDNSTDNSENECIKLCEKYNNIQLITLRKNFGEHNAVMCGLNYTNGDYIVIIDDDLQNPPSEIKILINEINKGYDVAYSFYKSKKHNWFRNFGSKLNGKVANLLLEKPKDLYMSSFKIIKNDVVKEIVKYRGPYPYIDGLIFRCTQNISKVEVSHKIRDKGKSGYTLKKLLKLYLNMFFNFSVLPIRFFTLVGFIAFLIGLILSVIVVIEKLTYPDRNIGWASIMIAISTFSGFQLMFLGVMGEYLGKLFMDVNKTPQYVIKKIVNGIPRD